LGRADKTLLVLVALFALFLGTFVHAHLAAARSQLLQQENRALTARLGLTDLALFTEARYTRHLSQADLHTAFQDHPGALEHFPSGSVIGPPRSLVESLGHLATKTAKPD
jgi:hypothetical protein